MNEIYERITKLCNQNDITGYRLAKDIGVKPGFLSDLKYGRQHSLSAEKANKVATYFGVSVNYLLTGEEEKPVAESDELDEKRELADSIFASLSQEDQELALAFLKKIAQSQ